MKFLTQYAVGLDKEPGLGLYTRKIVFHWSEMQFFFPQSAKKTCINQNGGRRIHYFNSRLSSISSPCICL